MGTKHKSPDVLDAMVEHVRYEALQVVHFLVYGNRWCEQLPKGLDTFARNSILEAGLIHVRCLVEFLGDAPERDQVMARDYLGSGWDWRPVDHVDCVGELHGRLAHLGIVRRSVADDGDFRNWATWLTANAPVVLTAFREFMVQLRNETPHRYELFQQPRRELDRIDLTLLIDTVVDRGVTRS